MCCCVFCNLNFTSNSQIQNKNDLPYICTFEMAKQAGVQIGRPDSPGAALGIRVISPYVLPNQVVSFMRQNLRQAQLLPNITLELWERHRHLPAQIPNQYPGMNLGCTRRHVASLGHLCPCFRPDKSWRPEVGQFLHMLSLSLLTNKNSMRTAVLQHNNTQQ